jgi:hypothetical protein
MQLLEARDLVLKAVRECDEADRVSLASLLLRLGVRLWVGEQPTSGSLQPLIESMERGERDALRVKLTIAAALRAAVTYERSRRLYEAGDYGEALTAQRLAAEDYAHARMLRDLEPIRWRLGPLRAWAHDRKHLLEPSDLEPSR